MFDPAVVRAFVSCTLVAALPSLGWAQSAAETSTSSVTVALEAIDSSTVAGSLASTPARLELQRESPKATVPVLPPPPPHVVTFTPGKTWIAAPLEVVSTAGSHSSFPVDEQSKVSGGDWSTQARFGLHFDSRLAWIPLLVRAEVEGEAQMRALANWTHPEGEGYSESPDTELLLRRAWGRFSLGPYLHLGGGLMTSSWGLGLLANDGSNTGPFVDPRGADRSLRAFVATGPITDLKLFASLAYDSVVSDDVLLEGDEGHQFVAAFLIGRGTPKWAGLYVVQRSIEAKDGDETSVWVVDAAARWEAQWNSLTLVLEGEGAIVAGTTDFGATPEFPVHDVLQGGLVLRGGLEGPSFGARLGVFAASGDGNLDDEVQSAFKADPRFQEGMMLFQHVLAGRTARAAYRAQNPELLGYPPEDLERLATRSSISNTVGFFPRGAWKPHPILDLYGGPLFAFALSPLIDPLETRLGGGSPKGVYGSAEGSYLGTELDVGVDLHVALAEARLSLALEGAAFLPSSALLSPTAPADASDWVLGGRMILRVVL